MVAEADADAARQRAEADEVRFRVEAEGKRSINEASNTLSADQIAMQVRLRMIEEMPKIIAESVRPMERIDGIKILQVDGLNAAAGGSAGNGNGGTMPDQLVSSALRYRGQAPPVDALLKELDLGEGLGGGMGEMLRAQTAEDVRASGSHASANGMLRSDGGPADQSTDA